MLLEAFLKLGSLYSKGKPRILLKGNNFFKQTDTLFDILNVEFV